MALPGPRSPGALLRTAVGMQRRPWDLLLDLHSTYGPICAFGRGPLRFVLVFGADANKLVLAERADAFLWGPALKLLEAVDGPTALVVSDGDDHKRRRRLVQPAFHTRRIQGFVDLMVEEVDRTIDGFTVGRELDAFVELRRTIRRIVVRALFGDDLREQADEIGDVLEPALDYVNQSITRQQVKLDLPGTRWRHCKRARAATDVIIDRELARRRAAGIDADADRGDILATLLSASDGEGGPGLTDAEIRDQVVSLIAAGYDTTSATMAWAVRALLTEPGQWEKAKAEVDEHLGGARPAADSIVPMRHLDGVVNETLRLWPPGLVSGRESMVDVDFAGHTIPAGSTVLYSPWVTHRLPELWPEPDAFRPERWEAEPLPYSFVPFGGGYRRCIGFAFATLELKVALIRLLQRVELTALPTDGTPTGIAALRPAAGVPVRVIART